MLQHYEDAIILITSCWNPGTVTLGEWWLSTERQANIRWSAPFSRHILRSSTPSSVVRGVVSNKDFKTMNGNVGNELAIADVSIWPGKLINYLLRNQQ
jgi:hypothetical protein